MFFNPQAAANTSGIKTQLSISFALGFSSFLAFCFLRTRWPVIFAPRSKLRRHTPPILSSTFFGWLPQLMRIPENELLDCVGLDAVMLLRFFRMCMKLFILCAIPGLLVVLPVGIYTGDDNSSITVPDDDDGMDDIDSSPTTPTSSGSPLLYLFTQFTFTWAFSILTLYMIWHTYEGYISIRRQYLLKRHKSITNRTVMVVGLPTYLQNDRALATFYESLGTGTVESAHVCRHVGRLKRLIQLRAGALRNLELVYAQYYGNPSRREDYDPEAIQAENERHSTDELARPTTTATTSTSAATTTVDDASSLNQTVVATGRKLKKRPTMRLGFLGIFGKKVDKIDHYREVFAALDKAVQKLRMSRIFAASSIGFVTFEEMHSAQILAQTVNTAETLSCNTFLAPEPRDVYWDNLNLPPSELGVRTIVINVIVFILIFFWAGPVGVLSSFLDIDSLDKVLPGISRIAKKSKLLSSLIQGFLPTLGVVVFLAIVPRILLELCRRQGIRSHSEIAQAMFNKYFVFILVNVVLVFTIVGTWAQTVNKVYHNLGELALLLAVSLRRVAPFFVNYTILRGVGLFPLQLLQIADVFNQLFQGFLSKTPRDYAETRAPPQLPYGVLYANATLAFVIIMIYSTLRPLILVFGIIYFAVAYVVYKYQLLYVFFHPNESGGQMWPMVYNRLTVGLMIFQLTMVGLFMMKQAYFFGVFLAPLPAGTVWFWYWTTNAYKLTAKYVPLELLRPEEEDDDDYLEISYRPDDSLERQQQHYGQDESLVDLGSEIGSSNGLAASTTNHHNRRPHSRGYGDHITVDLRKGIAKPSPSESIANNNTGNIPIDTHLSTPISSTGMVGTPGGGGGGGGGGAKRRVPKNVVDEDDYEALPDRFTDYRQPPMTLYPGVLNSGMRHYNHPALSGPLPTLWLPLRSATDQRNKGRKQTHVDEEAGRRADLPQSYDEGNNLVGGGQDEEGHSGDGSVTHDGGEDPVRIMITSRGPDRILSGPVVIEEPERDSDCSSDVTGGPSPPGSPAVEEEEEEGRDPSRRQQLQQQQQQQQQQTPSGSSRRNPALEGITSVYYHHPERRLSNASASSPGLRRGSVNHGGSGGEAGRSRSLNMRGIRSKLIRYLKNNDSTASPPPSTSRRQ
ncbi:hypothetical protein BG004_007067 [Podila humilis]|nr:hypothetical protein BG004_007067 [Podila humilis]